MLEEFDDKSILIGDEPIMPPVRYTVPVAPVPPITALGLICIAYNGGVFNCIAPVAPVPYWDTVIISVSYADTGFERMRNVALESYAGIMT